MKKLIKNYTFSAASKQIILPDFTNVSPERLLLIVNQTDGQLIYNFADPATGATVTGNTLTLEYDTTTMSDTDALTIYYDDPSKEEPTAADITNLSGLTSAVVDLVEQLQFLASVRGIAADLRVTLLSGTLTTLSTVTTVSTLTNMVNVGGYSATPLIQAQTNLTATQANINNIIIS